VPLLLFDVASLIVVPVASPSRQYAAGESASTVLL